MLARSSVQRASEAEETWSIVMAASDLDKSGVCVQRCICERQVCEACLGEINDGLDRMLALPAPMSVENGRHMMAIATSRAKVKQADQRREFKLPFSSVEPLLRSALSGNAGSCLMDALGQDAELCELSVIRSEPGAASQDWHSDSNWSASGPRMCTMFFALHDILEESLGPTRFCPNTHAPSCFPDERWLPPTDALVAERPSVWFALEAGDAVLMDALTWHCGGANTSERTRTVLAVTFVQSQKRQVGADASKRRIGQARKGEADFGKLRLGEFVTTPIVHG